MERDGLLDIARVTAILLGCCSLTLPAADADALLAEASVAFRAKRYAEASAALHGVLVTRPADPLANDFLATVYFLEGNVEAALRYWNVVDKPVVVRVDGSLPFSAGDVLRLEDWRTAWARGLEPRLEAQDDGSFVIAAKTERDSRWLAMAGMLGGVWHQAVTPSFDFRDGTRLMSFLRWDANKRRARFEVRRPFGMQSRYAFWVGVDARDERWLTLNLRRTAVFAGVEATPKSTWRWRTDSEWSRRRVAGVSGDALKQGVRLERALWRVPEKRFTSSVWGRAELGRLWMGGSNLFLRTQTGVRAQWHPQRRGDAWVVRFRAGGGATAGRVPFDELYQLGIERDNDRDLWLRGHAGTRDGRKGSAPLGRRYAVAGVEVDRLAYRNGLLGLWIGPFLDTGRIGGAPGMVDAGIQAKLRVLGVGVTFSYGRDLRAGRGVFYAWSAAEGVR